MKTKNWKTTLSGLITAGAAFVAFEPSLFPVLVVTVSKFILMGGLVGLGISAKDFNVTGGNTPQ